ncbi:hypothetical protein QUF80_09275 [Desulfococcaceae bacterium HSG8]|nr:hypothetical protein [Desulfococcaceae bacterium HSG8]
MTTENLWGELPEIGKIRIPLSILREQASLLGHMTERLLEASVFMNDNSDQLIDAVLKISVPALSSYTVGIVQIKHKAEFYPVTLINLLTSEAREANNEAEFVEALGQILTSDKVRRVIESLLIHIRSAD